VPGSSCSEAAPDLVVEVIGLTGMGREFADDLP
jgi:hypothetical protein